MAANDYFNHYPTNSNPYNQGGYPEDYSVTSSTTRVDKGNNFTPYAPSPYDNSTYPALPTPSQQTLTPNAPNYGVGGGPKRHEDPFADHNAIPMQSQGSKLDNPNAMGSLSAFDHDDGSQSRTKRKMKGFFSKRQPWVVYILSFVQLCVFIAEIAKNGKRNISGCRRSMMMMILTHP